MCDHTLINTTELPHLKIKKKCDQSSTNWNHRHGNKRLKDEFGRYARKTFDRFTTKDSYTWNITHNTESTAV